MKRAIELLAAAFLIAACVPGERAATRVALETEIRFVDASGRPAAGAPVYLIETLPFERYITQIMHTDAEGKVRLSGIYCAPVSVMVDGGEIMLRDNAPASHIVTISTDRKPSVLAMYGEPTAGYTTLRRSASYADCEPPPGPP